MQYLTAESGLCYPKQEGEGKMVEKLATATTAAVQGGASPDVHKGSLLLWLFCNIIVALFPFIVAALVGKYMNIEGIWKKVLKGGELFIFSSTLSGSVLGSSLALLLNKNSLADDLQVQIIVILLALILMLTISAGMFSFAAQYRFRNDSIPKENLFLGSSLCCSFVTIALGCAAAYQEGLRP